MTKSVRKHIETLRKVGNANNGAMKCRDYWSDSARSLGLFDSDAGVQFCPCSDDTKLPSKDVTFLDANRILPSPNFDDAWNNARTNYEVTYHATPPYLSDNCERADGTNGSNQTGIVCSLIGHHHQPDESNGGYVYESDDMETFDTLTCLEALNSEVIGASLDIIMQSSENMWDMEIGSLRQDHNDEGLQPVQQSHDELDIIQQIDDLEENERIKA
jgi:hypothetical protein